MGTPQLSPAPQEGLRVEVAFVLSGWWFGGGLGSHRAVHPSPSLPGGPHPWRCEPLVPLWDERCPTPRGQGGRM